MKGYWKGHYQYGSPSYPDKARAMKVGFEIRIDEWDGTTFSGTVTDDPESGGMEGSGTIQGHQNGTRITFVKQMPRMAVFWQDGQMTYFNRKNPKIHYSGELNEAGDEVHGTWKIRRGIIFHGVIPVLMAQGRGSWSMKKEG